MKMQNAHLAIASVPVQSWGEVYDQNEALKTGTVFKDLDMPFFCSRPYSDIIVFFPEEQKCNEKMTEIQQVSFVMDDLRLYLDTHPEDREALEMLKNILCQRKKLMSDFAADFYPLTMDCMAEFYEKEPSSACYCWQEGPAPWEGGDC